MPLSLSPKEGEILTAFRTPGYTRIGAGGSRGGGKSHIARVVMLIRRLDHPGTRGMIFRKKFPDLWENHIQKYFEEYPWIREYYNVQNKEITLPNGSVIAFRYAEHEADVDDFLGKEYMDIVIDEATQLSERALVKFEGCNRWPGVEYNNCKILHTMNPGGPGHSYMKRVYLTRQFKVEEDPSIYFFVPVRAWDNMQWATQALKERNLDPATYYGWTDRERFEFFIKSTQYGKQLNSLPEGLRIGWLLGNWDKFAGQYFSNFFEERTVIPLGKALDRVKPWMPKWVSMDWGFAHPSAVHFHCQDGKTTVTYRELYANRTGEREWGRKIVEAAGDEEIVRFYLSPDAFAKRTSANTIAEEIGDEIKKLNPKFPRPERADDDRVGGWRLMYELIEHDQWLIADACRRLIDSIPILIRQDVEKNPEDVEKLDAGEGPEELGDDAPDSARYALKSHLRPRKKPQEIIDREEASKIPDPFQRHFFVAKRQAQRENAGVLFEPKVKMEWEQ